MNLGTVIQSDSSVSDVIPSNGGSLIPGRPAAPAERLDVFDWWAESALFALFALLGVELHHMVINITTERNDILVDVGL